MFQNYSLVIAIAVFFIFVIASRSIVMNALKRLSDEDKIKLLSTRMINASQTRIIFLFGGLAIYYFVIEKYQEYVREIFIGFMVIILVIRIVSFITTRRKLINADLPDDYIKAYMNSTMLYTLGILVFFFLLMKDMF